MKLNRLIVNILKINSYKGAVKRRKKYPPYGQFKKERINVPYIDDGNPQHTFDVIYAEENRKNCCIFDIHGGSYIFGEHMDNYIFAAEFVKEGYDVVTVDYEPNNGKMSTRDLISDVVKCLNYVFKHAKELELDQDCFAITGDSAGGHFALTLSQLILDKEYAKEAGFEFPEVNMIACLANCPVYDFVNIAKGNLSKSGAKRLFGPEYNDIKAFELFSPKVHIDSLTCPLFVSTCKKDFLKGESYHLKKDMEGRPNIFKFIDLDEEDTGHVHNVLHPEHPLGHLINMEMVKFLDDLLKKN